MAYKRRKKRGGSYAPLKYLNPFNSGLFRVLAGTSGKGKHGGSTIGYRRGVNIKRLNRFVKGGRSTLRPFQRKPRLQVEPRIDFRPYGTIY